MNQLKNKNALGASGLFADMLKGDRGLHSSVVAHSLGFHMERRDHLGLLETGRCCPNVEGKA